jgi:ubiquinone/menaquinone biosynthesis C-methylase UbiE
VSDFDAFERASWARQAGAYFVSCRPITDRLIDPLLDAARVSAGSRVLDIGSGPGDVAARAAERGAIVVGLDFAEAMVTLASHAHAGLTFIVGDAAAPPFADRSFDAIVGNFTFHHLPHQRQALAAWRRLLRPGGWLALTAWDAPAANRLMGLFVDAVAAVGGVQPLDVPIGPPMTATDDAYHEALQAAGFDPTTVGTIRFTLQLSTKDALWNRMLLSSVRTAAMVADQPPGVRERIREVFDRLADMYMTPEGLAVPVSVKLITGTMQALPKVAQEHHERLMRHVDQMPAVGDLVGLAPVDELRAGIDAVLAFFTDILIPHMEATEHTLHPELRRLFECRDLVGPMKRQHAEIRRHIGRIRRIRAELDAGPLSVAQSAALRRDVFRLYAELKVHLAEEQQCLPIVGHSVTPDRAEALAVAMEHAGTDLT